MPDGDNLSLKSAAAKGGSKQTPAQKEASDPITKESKGGQAPERAVRTVTQQQIKRFYKEVDIERTAEGIEVCLDGRSVRTPMRAHLRLPTERLARAAAEWADQIETVDLSSMPMTGFANTALDRVAPRRDEVIDELTGYAETDLLCYRSDEPAELVERQEGHLAATTGLACGYARCATCGTNGIVLRRARRSGIGDHPRCG